MDDLGSLETLEIDDALSSACGPLFAAPAVAPLAPVTAGDAKTLEVPLLPQLPTGSDLPPLSAPVAAAPAMGGTSMGVSALAGSEPPDAGGDQWQHELLLGSSAAAAASPGSGAARSQLSGEGSSGRSRSRSPSISSTQRFRYKRSPPAAATTPVQPRGDSAQPPSFPAAQPCVPDSQLSGRASEGVPPQLPRGAGSWSAHSASRNEESVAGLRGVAATQGAEEDEDEAMLVMRCRREGPPGPAGALPALLGAPSDLGASAGAGGSTQRHGGMPLSEQVTWLCALQTLGLPFDAFHLGALAGQPPRGAAGEPSFFEGCGLAAVAQDPWPPRRWRLCVLVQRVEFVAGEVEVVVCDPTGEMGATLDRGVAKAWPNAVCEGATLVLQDVTALKAASGGPCWLLVMARNVVKHFVPGTAAAEEAEGLLAAARAALQRGHGCAWPGSGNRLWAGNLSSAGRAGGC